MLQHAPELYQSLPQCDIVLSSGVEESSMVPRASHGDPECGAEAGSIGDGTMLSDASSWEMPKLDNPEYVHGSIHPTSEQESTKAVVTHNLLFNNQECMEEAPVSRMIVAAWALVAGQLSNEETIVFDTKLLPGDGQEDETATTAPMNTRLPPNVKVSDYINGVYQKTVDKDSRQGIALLESGAATHAENDTHQSKTLIVIQQLTESAEAQEIGKITNQLHQLGTYGLVVTVSISSPSWVTASFDSQETEPWTIQALLRRFDHVLQQLGKGQPDQLLSDIEMMTEEDLHQIWEWNSACPPPAETTVYQMFLNKVQSNPDASAICAWDGEITYGKLRQLADAVASELIKLGLGPGMLVPLCFEKSLWTTVAIMGTIKTGSGFVLLDPSLPTPRLEDIVEQVKGSLILCSASQMTLSSKLAQQTLVIDEETCSSFLRDPHNESTVHIIEPDPSSIMYVVFTSGSTGKPKGAAVTYSNEASALHYQVGRLGLTAQTRLYDFASYSFDGSINNLLTVLAAGGCLCVPSDAGRKDNLEQSIVSLQANCLDLTPSVARLLYPGRLPAVKSIIFAGEALSASDAERWCGENNVTVYNGYGPSECTPTATINSAIIIPKESESIGTGAGLVTWVVNAEDHNELVPLGCVGELLLEGPLVGKGYLNDPEKTAAAFIENPAWLQRGSSSSNSGRNGLLYKTGDLVRYNQNGSLMYVCRKDSQVKLRGQRVELGEIEHVIRSHNCVDDAVVVLHHDDAQEPRIASFITLYSGDSTVVNGQRGGSEEVQHTKAWGDHFDKDAYALVEEMRPENVGRDFIGWSSMYDGNDIDKAEMKEWLNDTVDMILDGGSPGHVLEIGTGTGMILFNLTRRLQSYTGLEPSAKAVDFVNKTTRAIPSLADKVKVYEGTAADLTKLASDTPISPNLVIINSVVQYFPSQAYLFDVIQSILQLWGVETIFFGDVRSLALQRQFLLTKALHLVGESPTKDEIRQTIDRLEKSETELLIDPGFFTSLKSRLPDQVEHVEILPKKMRATNELSCYRYAAVIHVKSHRPQRVLQTHEIDAKQWINFKENQLDGQSLLELLRLRDVSSTLELAVSNIPYGKTIAERHILDVLSSEERNNENMGHWLSCSRQDAQNLPSLSAVDLVELADQTGCRVEISWARQYSQHGGLDAIFHNTPCTANGKTRVMYSFPADHEGRPHHSLTSRSLQQNVQEKARVQVCEMLQAKLPSYMIPQWIVVLDEMPLSANGKVDRIALKESVQTRTVQRQTAQVGQQIMTEAERRMQEMWGEILNMVPATIKLADNFFSLGGTSIAAMKLVALSRQAGLGLSVRDVFSHPELQDIAQRANVLPLA